MPFNACTHCHGTGEDPSSPDSDAVRAYMRATGWRDLQTVTPGLTRWEHDRIGDSFIGDVDGNHPVGDKHWRGLIERVAHAEGRTPAKVIAAVIRHREASHG